VTVHLLSQAVMTDSGELPLDSLGWQICEYLTNKFSIEICLSSSFMAAFV